MVLRVRPRRKPQPRVSKSALHFLARPAQYRLTDAERADLIQVVEGFTSPHGHEAARQGIEWMREPPPARAAVLEVPPQCKLNGAIVCQPRR
jgi:hypothetical protein